MNPEKKKHRDLSRLPLFGYRVLIFLAELFILIACIEFTQVLYINKILPDKLVAENYPQTTCLLVSKKLSQKGHLIHEFRADFLVSYSINDLPYQSWVSGNGLDQAFSHKRAVQEETLAQFQVGASYPCWYNPQIPQLAVLVLRHNWASTLPLAVPTLIGLTAAYYLIKNIFQFFGLIATALPEKKRRKK